MLAKPFEPPKKKASMALKVAEKKDEREEQKESATRDTVIAAGRRESVKKGRCEQRKKCDAYTVARLVANLTRSREFWIRHAGLSVRCHLATAARRACGVACHCLRGWR